MVIFSWLTCDLLDDFPPVTEAASLVCGMSQVQIAFLYGPLLSLRDLSEMNMSSFYLGLRRIVDHDAGTFKYYIKVVPTEFKPARGDC